MEIPCPGTQAGGIHKTAQHNVIIPVLLIFILGLERNLADGEEIVSSAIK